jgi:hypothetical protein
MSVVARDGQKRVVRAGNAFAETIQHYLGLPASDGEKSRGLKLGPLQKLRLRRVLAVVGRVVCEFEYEELATALGFKSKGAACRCVQKTLMALGSAARELGHNEMTLFGPRQGTALHPEPAAAD